KIPRAVVNDHGLVPGSLPGTLTAPVLRRLARIVGHGASSGVVGPADAGVGCTADEPAGVTITTAATPTAPTATMEATSHFIFAP
ncbi:MAG: hypothetical protein QG597_424, partial [Actinomycetota bacterium]|nr:hypothetical protein [Actinomycetota bacterium]